MPGFYKVQAAASWEAAEASAPAKAGAAFDRYRLAGGPALDFVAAWRKGSYLPGYAQNLIALMQQV